MTPTRKAALAVLVLTLAAGACRRQPPAEAAVPPAAPTTSTSQPSTPPAPTADPDAARRAEEARVRGILEQMVFFDYDDSSIRADSRQLLDAKVPLLRQYGAVRINVAGHADERGSTEYNVSLGTRRAASVVDYLAGFGLDRGRFQTVSYGEERPLAQGASEASWSRNRRAEFQVSGQIVP